MRGEVDEGSRSGDGVGGGGVGGKSLASLLASDRVWMFGGGGV